jgi:hypothetical protein
MGEFGVPARPVASSSIEVRPLHFAVDEGVPRHWHGGRKSVTSVPVVIGGKGIERDAGSGEQDQLGHREGLVPHGLQRASVQQGACKSRASRRHIGPGAIRRCGASYTQNMPPSDTAARRLRLALDLSELGEAMLRQRLRRKHPGATPDEIEAHVIAWRSRRPGAEQGDAVGRPVPWPRRT